MQISDHSPFTFSSPRMSGTQFLNKDKEPVGELAIIGEAEFVETPTSILTLDMRRVDDCVWVRKIEFVWPNIAILSETPPFPPAFGPGETEIHEVPHHIS